MSIVCRLEAIRDELDYRLHQFWWWLGRPWRPPCGCGPLRWWRCYAHTPMSPEFTQALVRALDCGSYMPGAPGPGAPLTIEDLAPVMRAVVYWGSPPRGWTCDGMISFGVGPKHVWPTPGLVAAFQRLFNRDLFLAFVAECGHEVVARDPRS